MYALSHCDHHSCRCLARGHCCCHCYHYSCRCLARGHCRCRTGWTLQGRLFLSGPFVHRCIGAGRLRPNATSIVQVRINQVSPEAFEYGQRDLSFVHVHDRPHCEQRFGQQHGISSMYMNLCNFEHWGQGGYLPMKPSAPLNKRFECSRQRFGWRPEACTHASRTGL